MRRKTIRLVVMLALVLLTAPLVAYAQPSTKVYRIGYLRGGTGYGAEDEAFKQRHRELGYTEGQNLVIEARFAQGEVERYPAFAAELVQLQVDCLVVGGIPAIRAAKRATSTIPIVMINVGAMIPCVWNSSLAWHDLGAISPASWTSQRN
jgi:putative ABC transport system substrate-binding protein